VKYLVFTVGVLIWYNPGWSMERCMGVQPTVVVPANDDVNETAPLDSDSLTSLKLRKDNT
jgi:hypothetical protein